MSTCIQVNGHHLGPLKDSIRPLLQEAMAQLECLKNRTCTGSEWAAWYHWPKISGFKTLEEIEVWKKNLVTSYDTVIVCGIGGSFAGSLAVTQALSHTFSSYLNDTQKFKPILFAGHNLSETHLIELLELLDERNPIVTVISKSGTTTEPSVAFRILRNYMEQRYGQDAQRRIVAITDQEKGVLRKISEKNQYQTFPIPNDIGGRYSVLTAVGLVPLSLAGYPCEEILAGADQVFQSLDDAPSLEHPCIELAAVRKAAWEHDYRIDAFSYSNPKLTGFVEWWKQLFGESEGKEGKGLFPAGICYSTDLHSLGQFLQEGPKNILETFLKIKNPSSQFDHQVEKRLRVPRTGGVSDQLEYLEGKYIDEINMAAMEGAQKAHAEAGSPSIEISIPSLSPFTLGSLFAFFECSCALSALLLGVNPFNQDGVEAYKKNLFAIMGKPN